MAYTGSSPLTAYNLASTLKECVEEFLATTEAGLPARSCVHVGAIAWHDCECGQLVVSIQDAGETLGFGGDAGLRDRRGCPPPLFTMSMVVSILRCSPVSDTAAAPPCVDIEEAARISVEDAWAVRAGVTCCLSSATVDRLPDGTTAIIGFSTGRQTFVGPQGMCQGSELPVEISVANGCYPCGES